MVKVWMLSDKWFVKILTSRNLNKKILSFGHVLDFDL